MTTKREVLGQLKRDELLAAADELGLQVEDRRVRAQLIEVLARSRKAALPEVLAPLSRARLKELCRALGLSDGGRAKADIIARLAGKPGGSAVQGSSAASGGAEPRAAEVAVEAGDGRLTREQLEGYLWSAADILRGSIDSSDYKSFIFGLLFLKRLSDRFDEECEALRAEGYDPEDPDEHQFFVPQRARWPAIRKTATNVGEALNKASAALEEQNSSLEGVLAGAA